MIGLVVMRGHFNVKRDEVLAIKSNSHIKRNTLGLDDLIISAKSLSHLSQFKDFDQFFAKNMEAFGRYIQSKSPEIE